MANIFEVKVYSGKTPHLCVMWCVCLHRTDGGHRCVGPEKSYRSCNIQVHTESSSVPEGNQSLYLINLWKWYI